MLTSAESFVTGTSLPVLCVSTWRKSLRRYAILVQDLELCCSCCWVASVVSDSVWPHRRQPTRLPIPSPSKNTGVGCQFLLQCKRVKVKVKSLSCVRLLVTLWTAAYQAPPSMGFSRQEYWSGVLLPSALELWDKIKNSFSILGHLCSSQWSCFNIHNTYLTWLLSGVNKIECVKVLGTYFSYTY